MEHIEESLFTPHTKKALSGNYITITHLEKPDMKVGMSAFMVPLEGRGPPWWN